MTAPWNRTVQGSGNTAALFTIEIQAEALATITEQVRVGGTVLETGGILLGHNHRDRSTILVAGDPGPNAVRHMRAFSRDRAHAEGLADAAWAEHQAIWVGEWHTHPEGLATPSDIDLASYLEHLNDPDLGFDYFVSLIIALLPPGEHPGAAQPHTASIPAVMTAWVVRADNVERAHITTPQETP
jgi:integrative and conjugative element protein (TIGR02256 family)